MSCAVVIGTHAVTRLYIEGLVEAISREYQEVHVVTFFNGPLLDHHSVASLAALGASVRQFGPRQHATRLRDFGRAHRFLRRLLGSRDQSDVFFANPNEALTNWLAFDPSARERFRVRLHLIPEGASNFYRASMSEYDHSSLLYRAGCWAAGVPFRANRGLVVGADSVPYRDYWYCGSPGVMGDYMPVREFEVARPTPLERLDPGRWLFFGQPRMSAEFDVAYDSVLQSVIHASDGQADYKPHPHERLSADRTAALTDLGFRVRLGDASGERMALSYSAVAGVLSTVLFNLRVLGWHDRTFGVLDISALTQLSGRPASELEQLAQAAACAGILPLEVGNYA